MIIILIAGIALFCIALVIAAKNIYREDDNWQDDEPRSDGATFSPPHGTKGKDGKIRFYGNNLDFDGSRYTYNHGYGQYYYDDYGEFKGKMAENKMAKVLWELSFDDFSHIMNNVKLPLYDRTCEIDHLVIGKFGVLVVETKSQSGYIYGDAEDKELTQKIGQYTYTLYNPLYQNKTHTDNVKYHLRKGNFRNVPVYGIVVFTSEDVEFPEELGIRLEDLPYFYGDLRNSGCNKEKVYEYFRKICVDCSSTM